MANWHPISYREFWDQPRIFFVSTGTSLYLFDCLFDETQDAYPSHYNVYKMPLLDENTLSGSWVGIERLATEFLGKVIVPLTAFDETRRKAVDLDLLNNIVLTQ